ncbi:hypothetical protein HOLleu_25384 [Holothuria leucospilota]|uniref:Integrase catalytic domain-containing protein n=1 Tax=Holothuria leucospilota TaxID=206669 RepID=A0A9Q1BSK2_HOLLE|nr:hypothetical protein HOLleu_25384 [Holothuria leucospilota]
MPPAELVEFDGDPLQYWPFMRSFENIVASSSLSEIAKLIRLMRYCVGKAKQVIQGCSVMEPKVGYERALKLLRERFGNNSLIAEAWVDKITNGPNIGSGDAKGLRDFADDLRACKETLQAVDFLGEINTQHVLRAIVERLPNYLRSRWLRQARHIRKHENRSPKINDVVDYVEGAAEEANDPVFGKLGTSKCKNNGRPRYVSKQSTSNRNFSGLTGASQGSECVVCKGEHTLFECTSFKSKPTEQRFQIVKEHKLCFNCLLPGHGARNCNLSRVCSVQGCGRKHTKFLHRSDRSNQRNHDSSSNNVQSDTTVSESSEMVQNGYVNSELSCNATGAGSVRVALPVVPVKVRIMGTSNNFVTTYALLDNGSTSTFCSEELISRLGGSCNSSKVTLTLTTLEKADSVTQTSIVSLQVKSVNDRECIDLPLVYTKGKIPIRNHNLATHEDLKVWPHLKGIDLPKVDQVKVGLLIGQNSPEALMPIEVKKGNPGQPYAVKTILGWTVNGPLSKLKEHVATSNFVTNERLESQLERFWKLDSNDALNETKGMSVNDSKVVAVWDESVSLIGDHYQMAVPFKSRPPDLPNNYQAAEQRLHLLGKRLQRDPQLHKGYADGMRDLVTKGYAEVVSDGYSKCADGEEWYLPHHPVFHPQKLDKLRIVFDCAAKYQGVSLNEKVLQGPDFTNNLLGVLLRFRLAWVAIMEDVEAMFYQVRVCPEDRDVLRYLWWPDGDIKKEPQVYRMKSHPFGGTWSPSCATYALKRTALDNVDSFSSEAISTVMQDFYVDDCLKSVDEEDKAVGLVKELCSLLSKGGFTLGKWVSNSRKVLESIPVEKRAKDMSNIDVTYEALPTERALGVRWNVEEDSLGYKVLLKVKPHTKRGLLSMVSSIYDPLGLVNPFTIRAKLIIQDLSRQKVSWDEKLPLESQNAWECWKCELPTIEGFKVSRCCKPSEFGTIKEYQLHHFSDASEVAYGCVSYLRIVNNDNKVHCSFLLSKAHLAPLKRLTIPRLELMAATLAVKVDAMLRRELMLPLEESMFWTDSTIVLQYIRNQNKRFHTFVANRVAMIHEGTSPSQWSHVESQSNPADDITRGVSAERLVTSQRWVEGPDFLWSHDHWPKLEATVKDLDDSDPEVKSSRCGARAYLTTEGSVDVVDRLIERYSSWYKLKRSVAYLLRLKGYLISKVKDKEVENMNAALSVEELKKAEMAIFQYVQGKAFRDEICALKRGNESRKGKLLKKTSVLRKLDPMFSDDGILRIRGRLKNLSLSGEIKNPVILPRHHITKLLIRHYHCLAGHCGREQVLSFLRERFWVIKARSAVRKELENCFVCKRVSAPPVTQKMADLPSDRVVPGKPPFSYVGVDMFGPFLVKQGRSTVKRYGCIFTCLVLRAVHIEVCHTMETDSFINALQRFICRRGKPVMIRSDNGSNFVGARKELQNAVRAWNQKRIHDYLLQGEIEWRFNPPSASHMGGVWERLIRSTRKVINSVLREQVLTDEKLSTVVSLVESVINSRPLTYVSDDGKDPEPLTPNHLLLLRSGSEFPMNSFDAKDIYCRRRLRQVLYLADLFWSRWIKEYLPTL